MSAEREEEGTTAVELVVAAALLLFVLALAVPIVVRSQAMANRVVAVARLHGEGRAALDEAVRRLRAARPPGLCLDPPGAPLQRCLRLGARRATLLQATPEQVCFASPPNATSGASERVLPAMELVCISRDAASDVVAVSTYEPKETNDCAPGAPTSVTYTTPCWTYGRPTRSVAIGRALKGSPPPLTYADGLGGVLGPPGPATLDDASDDAVLAPACAPGPCLADELARVVTVRLDMTMAVRLAGRDRTNEIHVAVSPRGAHYGREQTWSG